MKKRLICATLAAVMLLSVFAIGPFQARAESNLTTSDMGEAMIKAFEGFNETPKWDNKQNSVGWGCSITEEEWATIDKDADGTISIAGAQMLLDRHLAKHEAEVNNYANKYGLTFTQGQFDALVSLSFNIGGSWMSDKNKDWHIAKAVTSKDTGAYIAYAFALYSTSGGVTTQGHLKRRLLELQMYLYGIYDTDKNWPADVRYILFDGNGGESRYNPHGFNVNYPVSDLWVELTAPTGKDSGGNTFTYEFAGWYTEPVGGEKITTLDGTLKNGMILYAHWKNPTTGQIDDLQPGTTVDVKVKATSNVTMREGPCAYYTSVRTVYKNELLHITRVTTGKDGYQWGLTPEGWVRLDYTNYGTTGGSSGSTSTTSGVLKVPVGGTVTGDNVNIRTGPGTNYGKTGIQYDSGQRITILEIQNGEDGQPSRQWGKMSDGSWICMNYVTLDATPEFVEGEQTPVNPEAPDVSDAITVTSVEIKALPTKTEYAFNGGERVPDLTGGRIKVTLSSGTSKWIDITRGMVSGFDDSVLGDQTITVTVGGKSDTFTVKIVAVNITGISMGNYPGKVQYIKDQEQLDISGVTITVHYDQVTTETVPVTPDMVSGFDNTVAGTQTIVVSYKGFTTSFYVEVVSNDAEGISMQVLPQKLEYLMGVDQLDLTGAVINVRYGYTGTESVAVTADMVTGFDNTVVGVQRLTVTYKGFTTCFDVEVVLPMVSFVNYDGTVISSARYEFGATVTIPSAPTRPADQHGEYEFVGWDKEITACTGNATYTAVFQLVYPKGDVDRNMKVDEEDAIYLLRHVVFAEKYPVAVVCDYDNDGNVDEDDAIYLLRHVIFPEKYPLM